MPIAMLRRARRPGSWSSTSDRRGLTLQAGDVIYTPSGVGFAMKPPRFLQTGDVVRVEIDKLGAIEARMESES